MSPPEMHAATCEAHPNIALVKYWGKSHLPGNVPAVPSVSVTLSGLLTTTEVRLAVGPDAITLNGAPRNDARILECIDRFRSLAGYDGGVQVATINDFPTAAGLASSASGFAALVGALNAVFELGLSPDELSREARACSASAARSVHGGYVTLNGTPDDPDSWRGQPIAQGTDWPLGVVVAVCASRPKAISSADGMRASAATSPYYDRWVETAAADFEMAVAAITARDFDVLARVSESSCLKMHAVMMTTDPALLYWNPATLASIDAVRTLQAQEVPVFFTVDAGPQVKAVCHPEAVDAVAAAFNATRGVDMVLRSGVGGPLRLID